MSHSRCPLLIHQRCSRPKLPQISREGALLHIGHRCAFPTGHTQGIKVPLLGSPPPERFLNAPLNPASILNRHRKPRNKCLLDRFVMYRLSAFISVVILGYSFRANFKYQNRVWLRVLSRVLQMTFCLVFSILSKNGAFFDPVFV